MKNRITDLIELDSYTPAHQTYALDKMLDELDRIDRLDRVHAINISNRIGNRDRAATRRLVAMTRKAPQYDDGYGDTIDAMTDPIVKGGQGRDERDLMETGSAIVGLFWGVMFSGAIVATAILVKGWVW